MLPPSLPVNQAGLQTGRGSPLVAKADVTTAIEGSGRLQERSTLLKDMGREPQSIKIFTDEILPLHHPQILLLTRSYQFPFRTAVPVGPPSPCLIAHA